MAVVDGGIGFQSDGIEKVVEKIPLWAAGDVSRDGVPFGFAQGRLSTALGWRLASLRMTMQE